MSYVIVTLRNKQDEKHEISIIIDSNKYENIIIGGTFNFLFDDQLIISYIILHISKAMFISENIILNVNNFYPININNIVIDIEPPKKIVLEQIKITENIIPKLKTKKSRRNKKIYTPMDFLYYSKNSEWIQFANENINDIRGENEFAHIDEICEILYALWGHIVEEELLKEKQLKIEEKTKNEQKIKDDKRINELNRENLKIKSFKVKESDRLNWRDKCYEFIK